VHAALTAWNQGLKLKMPEGALPVRLFIRRIQKDRGQVVVRSGPYLTVRHPGYVGGILMLIALPLHLGSVAGLIPAAISIIFLVSDLNIKQKSRNE